MKGLPFKLNGFRQAFKPLGIGVGVGVKMRLGFGTGIGLVAGVGVGVWKGSRIEGRKLGLNLVHGTVQLVIRARARANTGARARARGGANDRVRAMARV